MWLDGPIAGRLETPAMLVAMSLMVSWIGIVRNFLSLSAVRVLSSLQVCCAWLATKPAHQHEPVWIRPT